VRRRRPAKVGVLSWRRCDIWIRQKWTCAAAAVAAAAAAAAAAATRNRETATNDYLSVRTLFALRPAHFA
jgi:hypothetical protein